MLRSSSTRAMVRFGGIVFLATIGEEPARAGIARRSSRSMLSWNIVSFLRHVHPRMQARGLPRGCLRYSRVNPIDAVSVAVDPRPHARATGESGRATGTPGAPPDPQRASRNPRHLAQPEWRDLALRLARAARLCPGWDAPSPSFRPRRPQPDHRGGRARCPPLRRHRGVGRGARRRPGGPAGWAQAGWTWAATRLRGRDAGRPGGFAGGAYRAPVC